MYVCVYVFNTHTCYQFCECLFHFVGKTITTTATKNFFKKYFVYRFFHQCAIHQSAFKVKAFKISLASFLYNLQFPPKMFEMKIIQVRFQIYQYVLYIATLKQNIPKFKFCAIFQIFVENLYFSFLFNDFSCLFLERI